MSPAERPPGPALVVGILTYLYIGWVLFGIGREVRTADPAFWILVTPVLLLLALAASLLPGALAGRRGARRWMRRLYLAGGLSNLWIGNFAGTMLVLNGGSYWDRDVVAYLAAGFIFLAGHRILGRFGPGPPEAPGPGTRA